MYIVTTDEILADALEVMLGEFGFDDVKVRQSLTASAEPALVDLDTVGANGQNNIITLSSDKNKGANILRPFSEPELKAALAPFLDDPKKNDAKGAERTAGAPVLCPGGVIYSGEFIGLSPAEERIMKLLVEKQGCCVSSSEIAGAIADDANENSVRVYVRFLRRKLDFAFGEHIIYTVRGKGYMIK